MAEREAGFGDDGQCDPLKQKLIVALLQHRQFFAVIAEFAQVK